MPGDSNTSLCKTCGMPQDNSKAGTIIDWISVCNCNKVESASSENLKVVCCRVCGKRIKTSRKGSMTSWIFQVDICDCKTPQPDVESSIEEDLEILTSSLEELEEKARIDLDSNLFPINRYRPLKLIGFGESGVVYLCKDIQLNKKVAVKQLHFSSTSDLHAFQKEARITSKLDHSNIVKIQDFGSTDSGIPYMVSEYVNGIPLSKMLLTYKDFPVDKSIEIAIQVCDGLSHAHNQGILHGDLCPENILLTKGSLKDIDAKLIDFGVARVLEKDTKQLAESTQITGSAYYLAPDKILGRQWTKQSEVYSIGCILFEMLTGTPPYQGVSQLNTIQLHANAEVPTLSSANDQIAWSDELEEVLQKALSKVQSDRYSSVSELREKLNHIYENQLFASEYAEDASIVEESVDTETDNLSSLSPPSKIDSLALSGIIFVILALVGGSIYLILGEDPLDRGSIEKQYALIEKNTKGNDPNAPDVRKQAKKFVIQKRRLLGSPGTVDWLIARYNFTDQDLENLAQRQSIKALGLSSSKVTGIGFEKFKNQDIKAIYLNSTPLTGEGLKVISEIESLNSLEFNFCKAISGESLKHLSKLKNLYKLSIAGDNLSDKHLEAISKIKTIKNLDLNHNSKITNNGIKLLLKNLPNLRGLKISLTGASPEILDAINKNRIRLLGIVGIGLTDKDLKHPNLDNLIYLEVGSKEITDQGFESLVRAKHLKTINLQYSPKVTRKAVIYVRKKLPNCYIIGR